MPTTIHVTNRYVSGDAVAGAAITFDQEQVNAHTPRTRPNGLVTVNTEALTDGNHVLHIIPSHTSADPVGPGVAENLGLEVRRMFRSLDVNMSIRQGQVQTLNVTAGQVSNGTVGAGNNPVRVQLQPIYWRSPNQFSHIRKPQDITLIVIHHTASSNNIGGTLQWFDNTDSQVSSHYVISAEARPQIVKVVQDTRISWQAGENTWWGGREGVNLYSIGIELSHQSGTPWPPNQITALLDFLDVLLKAYPSIQPQRIVGHMDILTDTQHILEGRDCPGLEFDWVPLEKRGFGLVPHAGTVRLGSYYEQFFRFATPPNDTLRINDRDSMRRWGGIVWPAPSSGGSLQEGDRYPQTVTGSPIQELQTDLRDIGYSVNVDGHFTLRTQRAVEMFQQHFFSGSRRSLMQATERKSVGLVTAEFIKRVR